MGGMDPSAKGTNVEYMWRSVRFALIRQARSEAYFAAAIELSEKSVGTMMVLIYEKLKEVH